MFLDIGTTGQWDQLRPVFGDEAVQRLRLQWDSNPEGCRAAWTKMQKDLRAALLPNSMKRLRSLFTISLKHPRALTGVEVFQRALDTENKLLTVAFAYKFVDLIEPAARRAAQMKELIVREPSSEEADNYLEEACQAYFVGLFTASSVMSRSLLEEALERKFPVAVLGALRREAPDRELTLGTLVHAANNRRDVNIPVGFLAPARAVNKIGTTAAHGHLVPETLAWDCLTHARRALSELLGPDPNPGATRK
jgi:hypothetical protein